MQRYRVRYWNGDSRLLDVEVDALSELDAMAKVRVQKGSHIGILDAKRIPLAQRTNA